MPAYWYNIRDNLSKEDDKPEEIKQKEFNLKITAAKKPYFMTYVYPSLRIKNNTYIRNSNYGAIMRFNSYGINSIKDLYEYESKTQEMINYLHDYNENIPVGYNPCIVNRICWIFEDVFNGYLSNKNKHPSFDYNILKSNVEYSKRDYDSILLIYEDYIKWLEAFQKRRHSEKIDTFDCSQQYKLSVDRFKCECEKICTNENELCDIILDICYRSERTKQFVWDVVGNTILRNLLKKNNGIIHYPKLCDDNDDNNERFEYCGMQFVMNEKVIGVDDIDDYFE